MHLLEDVIAMVTTSRVQDPRQHLYLLHLAAQISGRRKSSSGSLLLGISEDEAKFRLRIWNNSDQTRTILQFEKDKCWRSGPDPNKRRHGSQLQERPVSIPGLMFLPPIVRLELEDLKASLRAGGDSEEPQPSPPTDRRLSLAGLVSSAGSEYKNFNRQRSDRHLKLSLQELSLHKGQNVKRTIGSTQV